MRKYIIGGITASWYSSGFSDVEGHYIGPSSNLDTEVRDNWGFLASI